MIIVGASARPIMLRIVLKGKVVTPNNECSGVINIAHARNKTPTKNANKLNGFDIIPKTLIGFLPRQLNPWKSLARQRVENAQAQAATAD